MLGANNIWIGLNSIGRSGSDWRCSSTGASKTTSGTWMSRLTGANYCAYLDSNGKPDDRSCTTAYKSICQTNHVDLN